MLNFEEVLAKSGEIGFVEETNKYLIQASGLPSVRPLEMVMFENGAIGQVLSFKQNSVEILSFSNDSVLVGNRIAPLRQFMEVPVGNGLLGRVVDPFCRSVDPSSPVPELGERAPLELRPPGISKRKRIKRVFQTGVTLVDLIAPLGMGQRELVIGDRKTGKTSFLFQTIITQAKLGSICVYVAIGKKKVDIKKTEEFFRSKGLLDKIIIVAASSQDSAGLIYLSPFTGLAIAEYFSRQGRDVLVIFDDLLTHAKFYREIALLGRRFPGHGSYPGDIFYLHARILERGGNFFHPEKGEVSLTILPVVETAQSDFTGYIQSNLMSMTDGHLFFDSNIFAKGRRPAINPFLSVTRVGRQTQNTVRKDINREITGLLALYERTQSLAHFSISFSESIKKTLEMGERVYAFLDQSSDEVFSINVEVILFGLLWNNFWQEVDKSDMREQIKRIQDLYDKDADIRKLFDDIAENSQTFNISLGRLREVENKIRSLIAK